MVNIYKAFILPHLEYCAPVLVGLSSGLSNKLELTNQYAIRTLLNMAKSNSYSTLLDHVGLKTLEHRRYSYALCLFYKCLYNMGPNNIREMFLFRTNNYDLRGFCKLVQPTYFSRFMHRFTLKRVILICETWINKLLTKKLLTYYGFFKHYVTDDDVCNIETCLLD